MATQLKTRIRVAERMEKSGIFKDMTRENFEEKIELFLESEPPEWAEEDRKVLEEIRRSAENNQLKKELEAYDKYANDTRVLSAVDKFMNASMEDRDAELMNVIRVLNNAKNKYDKIQMISKKK